MINAIEAKLCTKPDCSLTVPFLAFLILVGGTIPFRSVPDFSNHRYLYEYSILKLVQVSLVPRPSNARAHFPCPSITETWK